MGKKTAQLSVREKVDGALHFLRKEHPATRVKIAQLARLAGVNRANLYSSHRELLRALVESNRRISAPKPPSLTSEVRALQLKLADLQSQNKALLYLTSELREEVHRLKARLSLLTTKRGSR